MRWNEVFDILFKREFQSPKSGQICLNKLYAQHGLAQGSYMFQSPKSGQICSNASYRARQRSQGILFQSPRSGQICSNKTMANLKERLNGFQSPRSGQICSNMLAFRNQHSEQECFNPLDRVKFVQILPAHRGTDG